MRLKSMQIFLPKNKPLFFTRDEFMEMIANYPGRGQILRVKSTSTGTGVRVSFQSFQSDTRPKASKPISEYLWDSLLRTTYS